MVSAFEIDKDEYKHNFEKEEHGFYVSLKSDAAHDFKIDQPALLPANFIYLLVEQTFILPPISLGVISDPDPPHRLYIRNSVFLI